MSSFACGVKISIKFFSTDVVSFSVHPAILKERGQNRSTSILGKLLTTACWFQKNVGKDSSVHRSLKRITQLWNQRTHCTFTRVLRPWRQIIQNLRTTQQWNQRTRESVSTKCRLQTLKTGYKMQTEFKMQTDRTDGFFLRQKEDNIRFHKLHCHAITFIQCHLP